MTVPESVPAVHLVPARDWRTWSIEHDAVIIDVREPFEWAMGTLPDSVLIRLGSLSQGLDELDRDRAILFVCRSGNRSGVAAEYLVRHGFGVVANLTGGLVDLGMA
ncbi:MAG: rhodanese-like domain-containing protein [Actinomycetota bacterium]|nr:rhodanese-like domain-containing protein [Actinomycetota bacterium]